MMLNYYSNLDINGYKNRIKNYDISNNVNTIILNDSLTLEKINDFKDDDEYNIIIDKIIKNLENVEKKEFIQNVSEIYLLDINDVLINKLLRKIIPYFEKNYNCYLKIIDFKLLKHLKGSHKKGAFLWHYDNHPRTINNIIIYLNDVKENCGGFEYITINNEIVKQKFTKPAGCRHMDNFIKNNVVKINQVTGNKGTIFLFDNNIVHRAGSTTIKDRLAILIQVFPSLKNNYEN